MKRVVIIAIILIAFLIGVNEAAAKEEAKRYIGLHDKMLPIENIYVIGGDTKVLLEEISKHLYIDITKDKGTIKLSKHGKEITLNIPADQEAPSAENPLIFSESGKLLISLKYLANQFEFKLEYFPEYRTLRIYRDAYPHISHIEYKEIIKEHIKKQQRTQTTQTTKKPTVYLTFDDGPNQSTLINHATLEKYNVPATFFFLGNQMKQNESIVKTVSKSGHYIGSHSMTHDKALVYNSSESFIAEMAGGAEIAEQLTGKSANLVRVPYGSKPLVTSGMQKSLIARGLKLWDWDVDSNDWRYTDKQAGQIVKNVQDGVTKAAKSGDKDIIILLHDRSQTTIALPRIIEWLQREGYNFKAYEPDNHIIQNFLRDPSL
ncbi:polysaccharide deacetylase [Sporosarcina luteola]|uniref:polysaccharide deacetylase family protein n=1 Tax=Sporosarcina luteola TaxID=582850 RepID=UPI00203B5366|nr:polysaccharide deacetylase family protein [Sporosarcina luteola]MCM3744141.1 polysaccharide deacetylase [Sporosarcina luteola]